MEENTGYVVMARKWRPSLFSDVVGQQHIVRALQNAITMNRIAGAYIFSGMRGVGKTSMARIFARSINCEKGPTVTPCGECKNCLEIANGSSMDVIEIDGASNNGVDEIRDIKDHVQYAPVKCRTKIYIIDEVHMLSPAAFNAFLKTLEEPPPHTLFIMATTEQSKIPETVLSRCQCFEFRAISDAQINQRLTEIAEKEKMDITPGAITMVARRAEGSMRDAQSMLDQAASYGGGTLDENTLGVVLGLVSREKVWAVMGAVMKKDTDLAIKQLHDLYYSGFDAGVIIRELCEASRTLAIAKVSAHPEKILDEPPDTIKFVIEMVKDASAGRLQQFYDLLLRARDQTKLGNPLSVLEMAVIKMIRLDDVVPVSEILEKLRSAPSPGARTSFEAPQNPSSAPRPAASSAPESSNGTAWDKIKSAVKEKRPLLGSSLDKAANFSIHEGKATLAFPADQMLARDQCEEDRALIEVEMEKILGKKTYLSLATSAKEPVGEKVEAEAKKTDYERKVRKDMLNHPMIQKAVEIFDGTPGFEEDSPKGG